MNGPRLLRSLGSASSFSITRSPLPVIRSPTNRYLVIHAFFVRQASSSPSPSPSRASLFRQFNPLLHRPGTSSRRYNSSQSGGPSAPKDKPDRLCEHCVAEQVEHRGHAQEYTPFIRRLVNRSKSIAPNSPHRPTKEELLAAASGWWDRLRIRLKWFTIRGWRKFNTDDLSAFASWFVLGNTLWIVIGTTGFVSAVLYTLNSLSLQEYVARWISDYMTSETGVTVIFESAIVPKWGASTITFRNVFVSRRPASASTSSIPEDAPVPFRASSLSPDTYLDVPKAAEADNYTMFDINLEEVEVTLSFMRWLDGKGLVKDARVKGVRGVVDRRSVWWDLSKPLIPAEWRHQVRPGDFELDSFHVEDALITVYQPGGQRPYNVSVFNAAIGPLRKRWFFYDLMSAEAITGQFDNCLFSLHMPQQLGKARGDRLVKRMARFRIDGLPIEHAQYASGHVGPISWITSGKLDAVLDIKFPYHPEDEVDFRAIFSEIGRNVAEIAHEGALAEASAADAAAAAEASHPRSVIPGQHRLARPPLRAPHDPAVELSELGERRQVTVDIDLRFRDLKAAPPLFTDEVSMTNNALMRPIVAFINANRTLVPIHCSVVAELGDFDGSWTFFETGLMGSISDQMYAALAHHVSSEGANSKRLKQVSVWGIQKGAEVLLDTLRNVVDPVHAQLAPSAGVV